MMRRLLHEFRDLWCFVTNRCNWLESVEQDETILWLREQEVAARQHRTPSIHDVMHKKGEHP